MSEFAMTIGGRSVESSETFSVTNPATEREVARAPECSPELLDEGMRAASDAFVDWRGDESLRREALSKAALIIAGASSELAPLLTAEQGKPLHDANLEILAAAMWLSYSAELPIPREVIQDDHVACAEVLHRPLGVVAAITPWNFPLALACCKIGPALLAGNTMVLKPSPFTPLTTLKLGELLQGILPSGVLNVVTGGDALGPRMTAHAVPRKVSFTGSVATGKKVAASAAPDLKRVTLELGGNDPAIVLDDVDPGEVADKLFWGAFLNCGQVCCAIKRVYVPTRLYESVVEALAARAQATTVGDGMAESTQLGPINNRPQYERVSGLVRDAVEGGARVAAGGRPLGGAGYFYLPTILAGLEDGTRIVDEEQFGPVLPVIAYRDVDDAVARANATHFGLSGSVWSNDPVRGAEVAQRLECGTAWVNVHPALAPHLPVGGSKWSGLGVENGPWGLLGFTEMQVLYRAK